MTEVYKRLNGLSPDITNNILAVSRRQYNTRHYNRFVAYRPKADRYGRISIPYRVNQIQNLLPLQIKNSANLDSFKLKIEQWCCLECPFTLSKTYLPNRVEIYQLVAIHFVFSFIHSYPLLIRALRDCALKRVNLHQQVPYAPLPCLGFCCCN